MPFLLIFKSYPQPHAMQNAISPAVLIIFRPSTAPLSLSPEKIAEIIPCIIPPTSSTHVYHSLQL